MPYTRLAAILAVFLLLAGEASLAAQPAVGSALTKCSSRILASPAALDVLASDGNLIYVGTIDGTLTAFYPETLEMGWRVELGGQFASNVLVSDAGLLVVTNSIKPAGSIETSTLRLISQGSGVTTWTLSLPPSEQFFLGKVNGGVAVISKEGAITFAERASGQVRWRSEAFGNVSAKPSFSSESIVFGTSDKQLLVISGKDGEPITKYSTDFVPTSVAFTKNQGFVAGDQRGNVALYGPRETKSVWRFKSGAGVSSVDSDTEGITVSSLDNFIYFISDYNGDVIWKRRLSGRVVDAGLAIEQQLVVLVNGENSLFLIDRQKGKITDSVPAVDSDLVSRVAVFVRERTFVIATINSVQTYSLGSCPGKQ